MKEEEECFKPASVDNLLSNGCIVYESNGDRNKKLPNEKYCNIIKLYLKNIINNLKKIDTCKIQLTIGMSSKIDNMVMHCNKDNIEIIINDKEDEVIEEFLVTSF